MTVHARCCVTTSQMMLRSTFAIQTATTFNVPLIKPTLCTTVRCTAAHGTEQQVAALHTGGTRATRGTPETSKETNAIASAVADAAVQQAAESLVRDHSLTAGTR